MQARRTRPICAAVETLSRCYSAIPEAARHFIPVNTANRVIRFVITRHEQMAEETTATSHNLRRPRLFRTAVLPAGGHFLVIVRRMLP